MFNRNHHGTPVKTESLLYPGNHILSTWRHVVPKTDEPKASFSFSICLMFLSILSSSSLQNEKKRLTKLHIKFLSNTVIDGSTFIKKNIQCFQQWKQIETVDVSQYNLLNVVKLLFFKNINLQLWSRGNYFAFETAWQRACLATLLLQLLPSPAKQNHILACHVIYIILI